MVPAFKELSYDGGNRYIFIITATFSSQTYNITAPLVVCLVCARHGPKYFIVSVLLILTSLL